MTIEERLILDFVIDDYAIQDFFQLYESERLLIIDRFTSQYASYLKYRTQCINIATNAKLDEFQGQNDSNNLARKFGNVFGTRWSEAIVTYINSCIGLPNGGYIESIDTTDLSNAIYKTGRFAMRATFQNQPDPNKIADKFGNGLRPIADEIAKWIVQCQTIPAMPPTIPMSPGGPIIVIPSDIIETDVAKHINNALIATYQGQAASGGSAGFVKILATLAPTIAEYAKDTVSLPGGGLLFLAEVPKLRKRKRKSNIISNDEIVE